MDDFQRFFGDADDESEFVEQEAHFQCFAHSCVDAGPQAVAAALPNTLTAVWPAVEGIFTGSVMREELRRVLLAPASDRTVLWHDVRTLPLILLLSERLQCRVDWLSVFEDYELRAYARLSNGKCAEQIVDPERYWRKNVLSGDDLIRKGIRKYRDTSEFLSIVRTRYEAVDTTWDFDVWMDDKRRHDTLLKSASRFRGSILFAREDGMSQVNEVGDCSKYDVDVLKAVFFAND